VVDGVSRKMGFRNNAAQCQRQALVVCNVDGVPGAHSNLSRSCRTLEMRRKRALCCSMYYICALVARTRGEVPGQGSSASRHSSLGPARWRVAGG
jgi:hypothetical protein